MKNLEQNFKCQCEKVINNFGIYVEKSKQWKDDHIRQPNIYIVN